MDEKPLNSFNPITRSSSRLDLVNTNYSDDDFEDEEEVVYELNEGALSHIPASLRENIRHMFEERVARLSQNDPNFALRSYDGAATGQDSGSPNSEETQESARDERVDEGQREAVTPEEGRRQTGAWGECYHHIFNRLGMELGMEAAEEEPEADWFLYRGTKKGPLRVMNPDPPSSSDGEEDEDEDPNANKNSKGKRSVAITKENIARVARTTGGQRSTTAGAETTEAEEERVRKWLTTLSVADNMEGMEEEFNNRAPPPAAATAARPARRYVSPMPLVPQKIWDITLGLDTPPNNANVEQDQTERQERPPRRHMRYWSA
ncbi:hypothetical protein AJ80_08239 [Polytolypa hystricis UAMH7299]|uniref:Uncharacterized protein n=1 Tax=Polytolypa hystricis (strain UAMH7299) TaxID=1447883 RepID=A0A2B7XBC3_POLH7|nr:hypothetical protein AJ80_08239 [Polytolypa hystricis UAMH7299]